MMLNNNTITVFFDGSCPRCIRDRDNYQKMEVSDGVVVEWFDITSQDDYLIAIGIDPYLALTELHIRDQNGRILSELDAYRVLMARVPRLKLIALLISLPLIRQITSYLYHWWVLRRLKKQGRLPDRR